MSKLESFDSGFWRDPGDPAEEKETPRQEDKAEANKKRMDALRRRQREIKGGSGIKIDPDLNKRTRFEKEGGEVKVGVPNSNMRST